MSPPPESTSRARQSTCKTRQCRTGNWQSHSIGRSAKARLGAIKRSISVVGADRPISPVPTSCGIRSPMAPVPWEAVGDDIDSAIDAQEAQTGILRSSRCKGSLREKRTFSPCSSHPYDREPCTIFYALATQHRQQLRKTEQRTERGRQISQRSRYLAATANEVRNPVQHFTRGSSLCIIQA
jgi:hypothetical protein